MALQQIKHGFLLAILASGPAWGQVFNCSSFTTTNTACGVGGLVSGSGTAFAVVGSQNGCTPVVSGTGAVNISCIGTQHSAMNLNYQTAVNVQAFSSSFSFMPNGYNVSITINNCGVGNPGCGGGSTGYSYFGLQSFSSGAGCEGSFYQSFSGNPFPINVFALMFDSYDNTALAGFTDSSVQIYQQNQSPCIPSLGGVNPYWAVNKIATSPVHLTSPAASPQTCLQTVSGTCDTYTVQMTYDGNTLSVCMVDTTAANGTCSSSTAGTGTYFQKSWAGVCIPCLVNGNTAYIGFAAGIPSISPTYQAYVNSWTYTVNTPMASAANVAPTNSGGTLTAAPTFSPAPGTYSGAQAVTISSTSGGNICYSLGAAGATVMPMPNNLGGCGVGTLYSGPVTISSSQTLYATAGTNGVNLPSQIVSGAYTISSSAQGPRSMTVEGNMVVQ